MDFPLNDESGVLIEGFELRPMIRQPWHPPYYQRSARRPASSKAMDLLLWVLDVQDREDVLPILPELAERARDEHGVTLRGCRAATSAGDRRLRAIYNAAWSENWGFVPTRRRTSTPTR